MKKKEFKSSSKRLLDMMINSIYTNKEIFLRELLSNASDALDKLSYEALTNKDLDIDREKLEINIIRNEEERTLIIEDNGIGMNEEGLERLRKLISGELVTEELVSDEHRRFGMANVEQRLEVHYGREYGITVESTYGEGTTVTVRIPKT